MTRAVGSATSGSRRRPANGDGATADEDDTRDSAAAVSPTRASNVSRPYLTDDTKCDTLRVMRKPIEIGAAELRQSLGRIAKRLERGEPIILKMGRKRIGAIVSLRDFEERFALQEAAGRRAELIEQILTDRRKVPLDADVVLRDLRSK